MPIVGAADDNVAQAAFGMIAGHTGARHQRPRRAPQIMQRPARQFGVEAFPAQLRRAFGVESSLELEKPPSGPCCGREHETALANLGHGGKQSLSGGDNGITNSRPVL